MSDIFSRVRVLIFALVLHPGLKLEYFQQKEWEQGWIDEAEELVREAYTTGYKDNKGPTTQLPDVETEPVSTTLNVSILNINHSYRSMMVTLRTSQ